MKRKINACADIEIERSLKKLKIEDVTKTDKSTQTEIQIYTDTEVQQIIRNIQSSEVISNDNFGQQCALYETKI
jgi:hypothetical protein